MVDTETGDTYFYGGLGWSTNPVPTVDVTVTYSPSDPSSGGAVTGTLSAIVVGQAGYSFNGGTFGELGGGNSAGSATLSTYYAFGPYNIETVANVLDVVLVPYDLAIEGYNAASGWIRDTCETIADWFGEPQKKGS